MGAVPSRWTIAGGLGLAVLVPRILDRLFEADLHGSLALVTGGSRGLGLLLARQLLREGCRVAICARDQDELARAETALRREGMVHSYVCDVSDRDDVERLVRRVTNEHGAIDILVNNAGVIQVAPIENLTVEDFQDSMGVMFWGVLYPTLAVLPAMRERRAGRIINITSIGGMVSVPHLNAYCCAKFAAEGFSEGLRAELAREGIQVTTIAPGLMRTGSHLNAYFKGQQARELTWFSLGASLPLMSMDAERAAAQIVGATKRNEAHRVLTIPATLLARFHGLFPGLTCNLLGLVNRMLPRPARGHGMARGMEVKDRMRAPWLDRVTTMGTAAATRFNQFPGPTQAASSRSPEG